MEGERRGRKKGREREKKSWERDRERGGCKALSAAPDLRGRTDNTSLCFPSFPFLIQSIPLPVSSQKTNSNTDICPKLTGELPKGASTQLAPDISGSQTKLCTEARITVRAPSCIAHLDISVSAPAMVWWVNSCTKTTPWVSALPPSLQSLKLVPAVFLFLPTSSSPPFPPCCSRFPFRYLFPEIRSPSSPNRIGLRADSSLLRRAKTLHTFDQFTPRTPQTLLGFLLFSPHCKLIWCTPVCWRQGAASCISPHLPCSARRRPLSGTCPTTRQPPPLSLCCTHGYIFSPLLFTQSFIQNAATWLSAIPAAGGLWDGGRPGFPLSLAHVDGEVNRKQSVLQTNPFQKASLRPGKAGGCGISP